MTDISNVFLPTEFGLRPRTAPEIAYVGPLDNVAGYYMGDRCRVRRNGKLHPAEAVRVEADMPNPESTLGQSTLESATTMGASYEQHISWRSCGEPHCYGCTSALATV